MSRKPAHWKRDVESIRRILMDQWNPIGFASLLPDDEYDSYIPLIYGRIRDGVDVEVLERHLEMLASETIGCPVPPEVNARVAKALLDLRNHWDSLKGDRRDV